jgi:hypothetical protein
VQRVDQTEATPPNTRCSDGPSISVARSSPHSLDPATATASSLGDLDEKTLVGVNISDFTIAKVIDKRPGPPGVQYKCEFQPLWWAAESAEAAQMGCVRIQDYENKLVRS